MIDTIILAGGLGTRLRELFPNIPKPLVPINGVPFLDILIHQLIQSEMISKITLAIGYKASMIMDHYKNSPFPQQIDFSIEEKQLGTGGALKQALSLTSSEDVLVLNGDSFLEFALKPFYKQHEKTKADITLAYIHVNNASRYGQLQIEGDKITSFSEKSSQEKEGFINAGAYLIKRNLLEKYKMEADCFSLEHDLFPQIVKNDLYGYSAKGIFIDIGTTNSYHESLQLLHPITRNILHAKQ